MKQSVHYFSGFRVEAGPAESLRYELIKAKLERLNYMVVGKDLNAAEYGLPQQRTRAWLLCIQKEAAQAATTIREDVEKFRYAPLPLSACPQGHHGASSSTEEDETTFQADTRAKVAIWAEDPIGVVGSGQNGLKPRVAGSGFLENVYCRMRLRL